MAFRISPGVSVREIDLTTVVPAVATSSGGFVGPFSWGPVEKVVVVDSENTLANTFGKPTNDNATFFFMAANFLSYSNNLKVVRVVNSTSSGELNATNAVASTSSSPGYLNITLTPGSGYTNGTFALTFTGTNVVPAVADLIVSGGQLTSIAWSNKGSGYTTAPSISIPLGAGGGSNGAITASLVRTGILIKNEDIYNSQYSAGEANVGAWAAKYPGKLGNSIKVSICPSSAAYSGTFASASVATPASGISTVTVASTAKLQVGSIVTINGVERSVLTIPAGGTTFTIADVSAASYPYVESTVAYKWEFASAFTSAPTTSDFALQKTGISANDEMHVAVVDTTGLLSGTKGYILEKYAFVSKISDAKNTDGSTNYYANVINRSSAYIWWMDHAVSESPAWGSSYASVTTAFGASDPSTVTLTGGQDSTDLTDSTLDSILQTGYELFRNTEEVDVSLLLCPPVEGLGSDGSAASSDAGVPTVKYVIQNVAEYRKDCVAFLSPRKKDVVANVGGELTDVLGYRNTSLNINSSYAVMDSGWKYQYDKYNDVYRWIPLSADVAGLCAQTDRERDPWFSPAGYNRGNIKNVVKLAWNPREAYRDELYAKGINPVVSFPGQGIVLFGDKTLQSKPSAFDRINVRRLFIVLEKAISTASKFTLFELNDSFTRASFINLVEPYLRDVKGRRGIYDFKVVCDETNNTGEVIDRNEFVGDIYIKPARSINFIQLNFVAVRTGVAFEEIVGKF